MKFRTVIGRLLLATVVPLAIVEALLQVGSLGIATWMKRADAVSHGPCAVLCVGDSFTYGLCASKPEASYPAQLELLLKQRPIDAVGGDAGGARVVNGGWPARNSRQVLEELARQIDEERPRHVVLLVGVNDPWSRPERFEIRERPHGEPRSWVRFELRLPKVMAILFRSLRLRHAFGGSDGKTSPVGAAQSPAALVGRWRSADTTLEFQADGGAACGDLTFSWTRIGSEELQLTGNAAGLPPRVHFRVTPGRLVLTPSGAEAPFVFERVDPDGEPTSLPPASAGRSGFAAEARAAIAAGDFTKALEIDSHWIAAEPANPLAYQSRIDAALRLGRRDVADHDIAWLRRDHEERSDQETAETLVAALLLAGRRDEAGALARQEVGRFPESADLWFAVASIAGSLDDFAAAEDAVDRSIRWATKDGVERHRRDASKYRLRARLLMRRGEYRASVRDLVESYLLDGDDGLLMGHVLMVRGGLAASRVAQLDDATPGLIEDVGVEMGLARDQIARIQSLFTSAIDPKQADAMVVLEDHLRQFVTYCREHGADPLLASYPLSFKEVERVQRQVAADMGVRFIDVRGRFVELLKQQARTELFAEGGSGHCNDRGYGVMASEVAAALAAGAPPPLIPR